MEMVGREGEGRCGERGRVEMKAEGRGGEGKCQARGGQGWRECRQKKGVVERSGGVVGVERRVEGVEKCRNGHGLGAGGWSWVEAEGWDWYNYSEGRGWGWKEGGKVWRE